jgi:hypothetical protein
MLSNPKIKKQYMQKYNSKRIGIITFHASDNCGSMLQTYALQKVLIELGCHVEIINFSNEGQRKMYSIFVPLKNFRSIFRNIARLLIYPILAKDKVDYRKFKRFFKLTTEEYSANNELFELDGKFDTFITGSDQVWNYKCPDFDDAYFLNFVSKSKKISYATSLGQANLKLNRNIEDKYRHLLSDFASISVRETNSKVIVQSLYPKNVSVCLDPTLLLNSSSYDKISSAKPLISGEYIICYAFFYNDEFNERVMALSKKIGMPVYMMERVPWYIQKVFKTGIKLTPSSGPEAFLNIFKNASMVFTTSFHGTVFSVINKKRFWYLNEKNGSGDGRASSLLNQLGLIDRYVTKEEMANINLKEEIDYTSVDEKLNKLQFESLEFLKNNIL